MKSQIAYLSIYSDESGCSHFEEKKIELSSTEYAPPAPDLNTLKMRQQINM